MRRFHSSKIIISFFMTSIILIVLSSCNAILFPDFKVMGVDFSDTKVTVNFSQKPERVSVIEAFSLTKDGNIVDGRFSINGNSLIFTPQVELETGYNYVVTITTDAESTKGVSLLSNYIYKNLTKKNKTLPKVTSITPQNEAVCELPVDELKISFSKDIKPVSFQNGFKIKPNVGYRAVWIDGRNVKVLFDKKLKLSTRYTVEIDKNLCDTDSNFLAENFTSTFMNGTDFTIPKASLYVKEDGAEKLLEPNKDTDNISGSSLFIIKFDETMDFTSLNTSIVVEPPRDIKIVPDEQTKKFATISFVEKPEWGKTYSITVKKGLKDISGNEIKEDQVYKIKFNNEKTRPVTYLFTNFRVKGTQPYPLNDKKSLPYKLCKDDYKDITFPESLFIDEKSDVELDFIFSMSQESRWINIVSAMKNIQLSSTNGCVPLSIKSMEIISDQDLTNYDVDEDVKKAKADGAKITGVRVVAELSLSQQIGQFNVGIGKDLVDNNKNILKEGINLTYNKL